MTLTNKAAIAARKRKSHYSTLLRSGQNAGIVCRRMTCEEGGLLSSAVCLSALLEAKIGDGNDGTSIRWR